MEKPPLEQFLTDSGTELKRALEDEKLTDLEKLARVAVIGVRWALANAIKELRL